LPFPGVLVLVWPKMIAHIIAREPALVPRDRVMPAVVLVDSELWRDVYTPSHADLLSFASHGMRSPV
jgi:hypothetical protein